MADGVEAIDYARSRAIIIGVSTYDDERFRPVPAAENSLIAMRAMLTDATMGGWPEDRVATYLNPRTTGAFAASLAEAAKSAEDALFFYFVGHGSLSDMSELCLTLSDTDNRYVEMTGLPYQTVKNILANSPARLKAVVLDCCFSGRAIRSLSGEVIDSMVARGTTVITAADWSAHVVPAAEQAEACTSFTRHLLEIIAAGRPHGAQTLTLQEIYPLLQNRLREHGLPEPNQRTTDTAGLFPFARNRALIAPGPPTTASPPASLQIGDRYALVVWRKNELLHDPTGRWYGETGTDELVQQDADRM